MQKGILAKQPLWSGVYETQAWHCRGFIQLLLISVAILLLGFFPLFAEWAIPPRYPLLTKEQVIAMLGYRAGFKSG